MNRKSNARNDMQVNIVEQDKEYSHPLVICDTDSLMALAVLLVILRIERRQTTMLHHASKMLKSEIFLKALHITISYHSGVCEIVLSL